VRWKTRDLLLDNKLTFSVEVEVVISTAHIPDLVGFSSHHISNNTQTFKSSSRPRSPRAVQATVAYDLKFSNAQLNKPNSFLTSSSSWRPLYEHSKASHTSNSRTRSISQTRESERHGYAVQIFTRAEFKARDVCEFARHKTIVLGIW
jgi:hypothetical protein